MKYVILFVLLVILMPALGLGAYLAISPYHVQLRAAIQDPAKRQAAAMTALDFEKMHLRALRGDGAAEYTMARHFTTGDLGFKDSDQAMHWYARSAGHGFPQAELRMAAYCFSGDGLPKSEPDGEAWAEKAAHDGVPEARDLMGALLAGGIGGNQDILESMNYLKTAHSSDLLRLGMQIDDKLKAIYALPHDQQDPELKKFDQEIQAAVRTLFAAALTNAVEKGVTDTPEAVAAQ